MMWIIPDLCLRSGTARTVRNDNYAMFNLPADAFHKSKSQFGVTYRHNFFCIAAIARTAYGLR